MSKCLPVGVSATLLLTALWGCSSGSAHDDGGTTPPGGDAALDGAGGDAALDGATVAEGDGAVWSLPSCTPYCTTGQTSRGTDWKPGVTGGIPDSSSFTVYGGGALSLGSNAGTNATTIQSAIEGAGALASANKRYVVLLPSGTWHVNDQINLDQSYVVLKGAGPRVNDAGSGAGGTRLVEDAANTDMFHGGGYVNYGSAYAISNANGSGSGVPQGASSFMAAAGHGIQAGDMIVVDKVDDSDVELEGSTWWKRGGGPSNTINNDPPSTPYRSRGQVAEVQSVSGNVITIVGSLHAPFPVSLTPQVYHATDYRSGWTSVGLENMTITGWGDAMGYWGNNLRQSWVKNVEFDGLPTTQTYGGAGGLAKNGVGTGTQGVDLRWYKTVRSTIEHCYLHHSRVYVTNDEAYSISLSEQSSDNLIEDNIVWFKNKNIVLEVAGSGNVIAYNYVDDPVIANTGSAVRTDWMEMNVDGSHAAAPVFELFEGNYAAKIGAAETHGNATDLTFFRNYSKGNRIYTLTENAGVAAVMLNRYMHRMNMVGNVLSTLNVGSDAIYETTFDGSGMMTNPAWQDVPKIFSLGLDGYNGNWSGPWDSNVETQLLRIGNYDYVRNQDDATPSAPLPDSLYLSAKPAFFGSDSWPWVDGTTHTVLTLPAQARWAAGTPMK